MSIYKSISWSIEPDEEASECEYCGTEYNSVEITLSSGTVNATAYWGCYHNSNITTKDLDEFGKWLDELPDFLMTTAEKAMIMMDVESNIAVL